MASTDWALQSPRVVVGWIADDPRDDGTVSVELIWMGGAVRLSVIPALVDKFRSFQKQGVECLVTLRCPLRAKAAVSRKGTGYMSEGFSMMDAQIVDIQKAQ